MCFIKWFYEWNLRYFTSETQPNLFLNDYCSLICHVLQHVLQNHGVIFILRYFLALLKEKILAFSSFPSYSSLPSSLLIIICTGCNFESENSFDYWVSRINVNYVLVSICRWHTNSISFNIKAIFYYFEK